MSGFFFSFFTKAKNRRAEQVLSGEGELATVGRGRMRGINKIKIDNRESQ
jgi:hypothetical protein